MDYGFLSRYAHEYDINIVKKMFYLLKVNSFAVLYQNGCKRLVMFRSRAHEEEYTINIQHHKIDKENEVVFEFSDEYDNYKIVLVNYDHIDNIYPDESGTVEWDFPHISRPCSFCGDGGCVHCEPHRFV